MINELLCFTDDVNNTESQQLDVSLFISEDVLTIIAFVGMLYVRSSTVLDRRMRIIGRIMVFIYMLELLMMVLKQYEFLPLMIAFHFSFALILLAATMTSLLL